MTQEQWDEAAHTFEKTVDALGKEIDPGIFDSVVAFNLLGMSTTASCEGHLEHGIAAPWLDLGAPGHREEERHVATLFDEARNSHTKAGAMTPDIEQLFHQAHAAKAVLARFHLEVQAKLCHYLDQFYRQWNTPFGARLIIHSHVNGRCRLINQGAAVQDILPEEEKAENLKLYQHEMGAFTDFLKLEIFR